jgi:hypothetical protein
MGSASHSKQVFLLLLTSIVLIFVLCMLLNSQTKNEPGSEPYDETTEHQYVTWEGTEADRLLACWLIKRYIDPKAEFEFIPIGTGIENISGIAFDMPGGKWFRGARQSTSELIYHEIGIREESLDKMIEMVRQLEMAYWMVEPLSDTDRFNTRLIQVLEQYVDAQQRLQGVFAYLDEIFANGGRVP